MPEQPGTGGDEFSRRLQEQMQQSAGGQDAAQPGAAQQAAQSQQPGETQQQSEESQSQQGAADESVGQGDHVVRDGECVSSIAKDTGHHWETIWDEPANAEVKETRENPNVLRPGDRLTIPELRQRDESCATEQLHRFRRLGEPSMLRLRVVEQPEEEEEEESQQAARPGGGSDPTVCDTGDPTEEAEEHEDEPRANVPYRLEVDSEVHTGSTDEDGRIEVPIPGNARRGRLVLNPGTEDEEEVRLQLGHIDPLDTITGVKQRLANLSFDPGNVDDEETPELENALLGFQRKNALEETGRADQATKDKLLEQHGC